MPLAPYTGNEKCNEVYKDRDGSIWVAVGYIDRPAAILENVKTGERIYEVIGCPNAERWTQLVEKLVEKHPNAETLAAFKELDEGGGTKMTLEEFSKYLQNESGATEIEYGIMAALVAVCIVALFVLVRSYFS